MKLFKYIKSAFLYPWNMLAFLGGMGFAVLSGHADVVAPMVLAGEVAYLGFLGTHARFQKYVDAQEAKESRQENEAGAETALRRMLNALPAKAVQRFEALRGRCIELRQIASAIRDPGRVEDPLALEEMQLSGLDRLLWIYLRLLFTQTSLERFMYHTSEQQIRQDIKNLENRLKEHAVSEDPWRQRMRKSIEDNLTTSRDRLANFEKARDNGEFVKLEIDRLENKIRSLSESAVNRQEPDYVSGQVDQVAASMVQTERTMNELQFATGLAVDENVPQLVERQAVRVEG